MHHPSQAANRSPSDSLLLAADVGNSRTKFGFFAHSGQGTTTELPECLETWAVPHQQPIPWPEIVCWAADRPEAGVTGLVAGANPGGVARVVTTWPGEGWQPPQVIVDPATFPLEVSLEAPDKVGIDRLLNAVAANVIRPAGRPCVIVDAGTATTVDSLSPAGAFEGGAILPGFELTARALHQYTALLPFITIDELVEESHEPLGTNTREALRSGLFWGQLGAIRELIDRLAERWDQPPYVLLTGGGAALPAPHLAGAVWKPHLALQGLAIVARHCAPAG